MKTQVLILLAALFTIRGFLFSQTQSSLPLAIQPASKLLLQGTSTMHDYSAKASVINGSIIVDSTAYQEKDWSKFLQKVDISVPVKGLLSGDEKLDDNMHDALKAEDHENITYRMTNAVVAHAGGDTATLKIVGTLSVGGKEKETEMVVTLMKSQDGTLRIKGSTDLLMTDFDIDPPTFLFVLTTDNKVKISFVLIMQEHTHVHK